ncbi:hypothetical protein MP228_007397 [Amoeboaphelidium protococcarum]|nr:hypothetical protein MP228_007397 [Amoeboaphelidium protococcarum]
MPKSKIIKLKLPSRKEKISDIWNIVDSIDVNISRAEEEKKKQRQQSSGERQQQPNEQLLKDIASRRQQQEEERQRQLMESQQKQRERELIIQKMRRDDKIKWRSLIKNSSLLDIRRHTHWMSLFERNFKGPYAEDSKQLQAFYQDQGNVQQIDNLLSNFTWSHQ